MWQQLSAVQKQLHVNMFNAKLLDREKELRGQFISASNLLDGQLKHRVKKTAILVSFMHPFNREGSTIKSTPYKKKMGIGLSNIRI